MTRGAGTTPAWVVTGAWPGSGVPVASSSVSQQSLLSDFIGGRDSSEVLTAGGAENTKVVGVPPDLGTCSSISGGTVVRARTSSLRELVRAHLTVRRNFW